MRTNGFGLAEFSIASINFKKEVNKMDQFVVLNSSGSIDIEASVSGFRAQLEKYVAESEAQKALIREKIHETFDERKGSRFLTNQLVGIVSQKLNSQAENYKVLDARIRAVIQSENAAGVLKTIKGKVGGVVRVSDITADATV